MDAWVLNCLTRKIFLYNTSEIRNQSICLVRYTVTDMRCSFQLGKYCEFSKNITWLNWKQLKSLQENGVVMDSTHRYYSRVRTVHNTMRIRKKSKCIYTSYKICSLSIGAISIFWYGTLQLSCIDWRNILFPHSMMPVEWYKHVKLILIERGATMCLT